MWFTFYRIFNVNLKAVVNVSQVVAKRMVADKTGGSIVNVSSQVLKSINNMISTV